MELIHYLSIIFGYMLSGQLYSVDGDGVMKMKKFIHVKKMNTSIFIIANIVLFFLILLICKAWLNLPPTVSLTIFALQFIGSQIFLLKNTITYFDQINHVYVEPIEALNEVVDDFRTTRNFKKRLKVEIEVDEIKELMDGFTNMANDLSGYYKQIHERSMTEEWLNKYNTDLMEINNVRDIFATLYDTVKRLIPCDYASFLSIENGIFIEKHRWNNLYNSSSSRSSFHAKPSRCPALMSNFHKTDDELFGNNGCSICFPIAENRQSSICYQFTYGGFPYIIIHLGSRTSNYFKDTHLEMLKRIEQTTGLRINQISKTDAYEQKAYKDKLTDLFNKHYITEQIEGYIRNSTPFSITLFDVDNFKKVNDTYGHIAGDIVLKGIASILQERCPSNAFAGRYGGEELMIITNNPDYVEVIKHSEEMRVAIQNHKFEVQPNLIIPITTSIGVSSYPIHGVTYEEVFTKADEALYKAKQSGKNQVKFWKHN